MANKVEFKYAPMFQVGKDDTEYRLLTKEGVTTSEFEGKQIVKVSKEALTLLAQQAFHDVEFMLRRAHNEQVAAILSDPEASENDKYVALQFLRNAETAVKGILPFCQDTGTAIIQTRKRSHSASTTPSLKTTCAILRMLRSTCMMRLTPNVTCLRRLISKQQRVQSIVLSW